MRRLKISLMLLIAFSVKADTPQTELCVIAETGRFETQGNVARFVINGCDGKPHNWKIYSGESI